MGLKITFLSKNRDWSIENGILFKSKDNFSK